MRVMTDRSRPHCPAPDVDGWPTARVRGLASSLLSTVQMFQVTASTAPSIDLAGLDATVGLLCAKTLDLDPEEGRLLLPDLLTVLAELTTLSGKIAERAPPAG